MPFGGSRRGANLPGELPPEQKFPDGNDDFMRTQAEGRERADWDWMYANEDPSYMGGEEPE